MGLENGIKHQQYPDTHIYIHNYTVIWDVSLWGYHSVDRLMGEYNVIHNQQLQYDVGLFENKGAAKLWLF